jgi:hypothetical protein
MAIGDKIGEQTVGDLNQFVHSWLDDLDRRLRAILDDYKIELRAERKDPKDQVG